MNTNTTSSQNSDEQMSDQEILGFYNLATGKILTALEVIKHWHVFRNGNWQWK